MLFKIPKKMSQPNSFYIEIDVPSDYLLCEGAKITFELSKKCCNGADEKEFHFLLTRVKQCNGALLNIPIVQFIQHQREKMNQVDMIIVSSLKSDPLIVSCARSLIRIEYF